MAKHNKSKKDFGIKDNFKNELIEVLKGYSSVLYSIEKNSIKKEISLKSKLVGIFFDKIFLGIILFVATTSLATMLNTPKEPIVYSISTVSNERGNSINVTTSKHYANSYYFNEDLKLTLKFSSGIPQKIFLVYSKDDSKNFTENSFHEFNFNKPFELFTYFNYRIKAEKQIEFLSKQEKLIKPFFIVVVDSKKNYSIDLVLFELKSLYKAGDFDESHKALYTEFKKDFKIIKLSSDDFAFIQGENILGSPQTPDNYIKFSDIGEDPKFDKSITKKMYLNRKDEIETILNQYYIN